MEMEENNWVESENEHFGEGTPFLRVVDIDFFWIENLGIWIFGAALDWLVFRARILLLTLIIKYSGN